MEKIAVQLQGGLANNLFQIAAAYAYGLEHGKTPFFPDVSTCVTFNPLSSYSTNILRNVSLSPLINEYPKVYNESGFHFNKIPEVKGNLFITGYYQSEKYFSNYKEEIRKLFSYPDEYVTEIKQKYERLLVNNTCALHVRRGDYVAVSDYHPTQDLDYYVKAIETIESLGLENMKFLVFSDDIEWCKSAFSSLDKDFVYIENNPDYEDLLLMSLCDHNIIGNSTFSWWGAWLNSNTEKTVVSPMKWFGPGLSFHDTRDIYCENWIKI